MSVGLFFLFVVGGCLLGLMVFTLLRQQLSRTIEAAYQDLRYQLEHEKGCVAWERQEKETILENLAEGVLVVDREGTITALNSACSRILGIPKRQLLENKLPLISQTASVKLLEKCAYLLQACLERSIPVTGSHTHLNWHLDVIVTPKPDRAGAAVIFQDKSSEYKVLDVGKAFIANASHELRTPITIIKGFAETLHDMPQLPNEMFVDIIDKILRNCQRMETLVKNLLTLADIENLPKTRLQPCDLAALADRCRQQLKAACAEACVELAKNRQQIWISADRDLLELALMNLLQNGVKYSASSAQLKIDLQEKKEEVVISISDQGMGIPDNDLPYIFDRFYTVDKAHSRKLGGAGLGLAIVKTIVEIHDGTMVVHSKVGKGTVFNLHFPKPS